MPTNSGVLPAITWRFLPVGLRNQLENSLRADLSALRVITGPVADYVTRRLDADAITIGAAIWFRDGAYQPGTRQGQWLIAHEAAHVVQQAASAGRMPARPAAVSEPGDDLERQADLAADLVLAGLTWDGPSIRPAPLIQRHVSFEHRLLGDSPTADLVAISTKAPNRPQLLQNQIKLLGLWQDNPHGVTPEKIKELCPWITTTTIGPGRLLVTYGELNALPDYLADGVAVDSLDPEIVLPILQVIRQEGFNQLTLQLTGANPNVTFADAACAPWSLSLVNNIVETTALDTLTQGIGPQGQDHYQGLLARNACHFAPFSWYRWQASYLIARDLAAEFYITKNPEVKRQALIFGGYGDHFLEDSFAAGHLVNKTLVMQWFIEWAATQSLLPVADWDVIKNITTSAQPALAGLWLYDPAYPGPSNDPQTAQEAATLVNRIFASSVRADGPSDLYRSYQNYLTFLTSAAAQLASATLHDYYNAHSLWVSSAARTTPFEIWGDDTLLTGANGGNGVQATSETAQLSSRSLTEIMQTGQTSITTQQIRDHFPTRAGTSSGSLTDLRSWTTSQRSFCVDQFSSFLPVLETLLLSFSSPTLGLVSQDQEWSSIWSTSLPDSGYYQVDNLLSGGRLFSGSNGYVYELDPTSGKVLHELHLTTALGGDVTQLATDGSYLFAGVHGYVYGINLADWTSPAWATKVGGTLVYDTVSVLAAGGRLFAGSFGYAYELRPSDGTTLHTLTLSSLVGAEVRLATGGGFLFAGTHGYAYGINLADWSKYAWSTRVGSTLVYDTVSVLFSGGALYAGTYGTVYQLQPAAGTVMKSLGLSSIVGGAEVRLAANGDYLYAGTHGYMYAVRLTDWSAFAWSAGVGGTSYGPVSVACAADGAFAGANGYVYEVDQQTGLILHSSLLTYKISIGEFDTSLIVDGQALYAGVHGYSSRLLFNRVPTTAGTLWHASENESGWSGFEPDFDGAPKVSSVFGLIGVTGHTEMFAVGTDGTLYHDMLDNNGWHGWTPHFLSAPLVRSVFAVDGMSGSTEVFAVCTDGTLYHNYLNTSEGWHAWQPNFNSAPKVASVFGVNGATGHTEVFAIGTDGTLFHNVLDNDGWHGWGPDFDNAPKVRSVFALNGVTGNTEVFAIGASDGTLYHDTLDQAGWHGWTPDFKGAPKAVSVYAADSVNASTEVFVIGTDGTLYRNFLDSSDWHAWEPDFNGAPKMRAITGPAIRPERITATEFFGIDLNGVLYRNVINRDGWHGWRPNFAANGPAVTWSAFSVGTTTGAHDLFVISG